MEEMHASTPERCAICANIRTIRKERGLTQAGLAEELGMTQGAYSQIENGLIAPNIDTLSKLARALKVKLKAIVDDETSAAREAIRHLRRSAVA